MLSSVPLYGAGAANFSKDDLRRPTIRLSGKSAQWVGTACTALPRNLCTVHSKKSASLTQNMNVMHCKTKVSHNTHGTHLDQFKPVLPKSILQKLMDPTTWIQHATLQNRQMKLQVSTRGSHGTICPCNPAKCLAFLGHTVTIAVTLRNLCHLIFKMALQTRKIKKKKLVVQKAQQAPPPRSLRGPKRGQLVTVLAVLYLWTICGGASGAASAAMH